MGHEKLQNQQEIAELEALAAANDANAQFRHGNFCCLFWNRVIFIHTDKQTAETKTWGGISWSQAQCHNIVRKSQFRD